MKAASISLDRKILVECKLKKMVVIRQYRIATAIQTIPIISDSIYNIHIVSFF